MKLRVGFEMMTAMDVWCNRGRKQKCKSAKETKREQNSVMQIKQSSWVKSW
jgi:hypothetical protein